jgi:CRP-like cAMP-binding protein
MTGSASEAMAQHPLVMCLPAAQRDRELAGCERRTVTHDTILFKDGEPAQHVFFLLTGAVRVYYTRPDGSELTGTMIAAPSFFGEAEAITGIPFIETVSAIGSVEILVVPIAEFTRLLQTYPRFGYEVVRDLAARFAAAIYHQKSLAFDPVTIRLANFLLDHLEWSADRFDAAHVTLTQEEMALAIGASRRSITKDLSMWKEHGILQKGPRGYRVLKLEALAGYADPRRVSVHHQARSSGQKTST